MSTDVDARVSQLLDQLNNPLLTDAEVERIQKKIDVLRDADSD